MRGVRPSLLLLLVLLVGLLGAPAAARADETAPDYPVPGGAFFTEALPGRTDGSGFAVQDGHGVKLWTAFQSLGGVAALGYPVTRRFDWNGAVAQAFEAGVLRIDPATGAFDLRPARDLPGG